MKKTNVDPYSIEALMQKDVKEDFFEKLDRFLSSSLFIRLSFVILAYSMFFSVASWLKWFILVFYAFWWFVGEIVMLNNFFKKGIFK